MYTIQATTSLSHCWLWSCCDQGGDTVASEVFCFSFFALDSFQHLSKQWNLWSLKKTISQVFCFSFLRCTVFSIFSKNAIWEVSNQLLRLMQRTLGLTVEGRQVMTINHIENIKTYIWMWMWRSIDKVQVYTGCHPMHIVQLNFSMFKVYNISRAALYHEIS